MPGLRNLLWTAGPVGPDTWQVEITCVVGGAGAGRYRGRLVSSLAGLWEGQQDEVELELEPGSEAVISISRQLPAASLQLWWPAGLGAQQLYQLEVGLPAGGKFVVTQLKVELWLGSDKDTPRGVS